MPNALLIDYYADILCVWAWIAQPRIQALEKAFAGQIELRPHCIDVFGDVPGKIDKNWKKRGGYEGFAQHVQDSVAHYEASPVNAAVWTEVRPTTSANAHLMVKAVELNYDRQRSMEFALQVRKAFFLDALDISQQGVLEKLLSESGFDIGQSLRDGSAMAALMSDYQDCRRRGIQGSPSYVLNDGRQTLFGNVGYRVLKANVEEVLKHPSDEASWC